MMQVNIIHLYPDLLNLYGDRGNIMCLKKRLEWRGIKADIKTVCHGEYVDTTDADLIFLGGGSDREQEIVCEELKKNKSALVKYVEDGGVMLAICGGYQLLGNYYQTSTKKIEGLGILDIYTEWEQERLVRNIIINSDLFETPIVGYENHSGRTYIGNYNPLGKVFFGLGNTGKGDFEGVVYKNVIGTYIHGPLLPKNPQVCDYVLEKALKRKYGDDVKLSPLDDEIELKANKCIVDRYSEEKNRVAEAIKRRI
jgi:hypothetical protein